MIWHHVLAQKNSTGSGNWSNTAAVWGGVAPVAADEIHILNGHSVTLDASLSTISKIVVEAGGALTLNNNTYNLGATTTEVYGELVLANTLTTTSPKRFSSASLIIKTSGKVTNNAGNAQAVGVTNFTIEGNGWYVHNAIGSTSAGTAADFPGNTNGIFSDNSTVEFLKWGSGTSTNRTALPVISGGWGNIIVNITDNGSYWGWQGSVTLIKGNLEIENTGGGTKYLRLADNNHTFTIKGSLVINGGRLHPENGGTRIFNYTIEGDIIIDGGYFDLSGNSANNTMNINITGTKAGSEGKLHIKNGTVINPNSSSVEITTFGDIIVESSATFTIYGTSTLATSKKIVLNIGGDFLINTGGIFTSFMTGSSSAGKAKISFVEGKKANVVFTPPALFEIWNCNIYIDPEKTVQLTESLTSKNSSSSNINEIKVSGTLDLGNNTIRRTVATAYSNFSLEPGASIKTAHSGGLFFDANSNSTAAITLNAARVSFSDKANYIFTGTSNQVTSTSLPSPLNGNLVINNTGAVNANRVQLSKAIVIADTGHLMMENGLLDKNGFSINVTNPAIDAVQGGNSRSFVMHELRRSTSAATAGQYWFPVGKLVGTTEYYNPAYVLTETNLGSDFRVEYLRSNPPNTAGFFGPGLLGIQSNQYWQIDRLTGTTYARVAFNYQNPGNSNWKDYDNEVIAPCGSCNVAIVHQGSNWAFTSDGTPGFDYYGAPPQYRPLTENGYIISKVMSSFSPFTFGFGTKSVLPIQLLAFNGIQKNNGTVLNWQIADSDNELLYTELEYSTNGMQFLPIVRLSPNTGNNYSYEHSQANHTASYYRLKITDKLQNITYSQVLKFSYKDINLLKLYPTLASDQVQLMLHMENPATVDIKIVDITGRAVLGRQLLLNKGIQNQQINVNSFSKGDYIVIVTINGERQTLKFVKQ
ncbi:T9SS type A sorting domain-containing protein [Polluticaenibacter yanchengensis]|uniref:T9SS type A sorting domain-containing protein n=1 Tax=Polluticaenibacter yanchengensis TaxID=3014562 RepID=A0ABT4UGR1_9BACT|nr:T9SS type A sorting domain-containing protein [Chitinophagaceae bacterium LY-5]